MSLEKNRSIRFALAVEALAEAGLPLAVALRRDVGRGTLVLDQLPDAVSVVGLVR